MGELTKTSPAEIVSRGECGVDFGVKRKLLAQVGDKKLTWVPGHKGWASVGYQRYYPGHFTVTWFEYRRGSLFQWESFYPADHNMKAHLAKAIKSPEFLTWITTYFEAPVIAALEPNTTVKETK